MSAILSEALNRLSELNAAVTGNWEPPRFPRLQYHPSGEYLLSVMNAGAISRLAQDLLSLGEDGWAPNPDLFETLSTSEVVIGTVDRYGLPLRTVFSTRTGLMRSDPYYSESFLKDFYKNHYRGIYDGPDDLNSTFTRTRFFRDQVSKGVDFYEMLKREKVEFESVLDFGCGMGGMLVPFKQSGKRCVGSDWGERYLEEGRRLGLNLIEGGLEELRREDPFDLVILCHSLEHVKNVKEFLRQIYTLLSDDGAIVVEVPGIFGIPNAYKGNILWFLQNAHAWHFTQPTLERLLRKTGFWPIYTESTSKIRCIATKSPRSHRRVPASTSENGLKFLEKLEKDFCSPFKSLNGSIKSRLGHLRNAVMPPRRWLPLRGSGALKSDWPL